MLAIIQGRRIIVIPGPPTLIETVNSFQDEIQTESKVSIEVNLIGGYREFYTLSGFGRTRTIAGAYNLCRVLLNLNWYGLCHLGGRRLSGPLPIARRLQILKL